MGKALRSSSADANEIESRISFETLIKEGAPKDSCKDRAPVILALSNLVSLGGPIKIWLSVEIISLSSNSTSLYITTSFSGRFDFFVGRSICSVAFAFASASSEICSVSTCFFRGFPELVRFALDSAFLAVFSLMGCDDFDRCFLFEECLTTKNTAKDNRYIIKRCEFYNLEKETFLLYTL